MLYVVKGLLWFYREYTVRGKDRSRGISGKLLQ